MNETPRRPVRLGTLIGLRAWNPERCSKRIRYAAILHVIWFVIAGGACGHKESIPMSDAEQTISPLPDVQQEDNSLPDARQVKSIVIERDNVVFAATPEDWKAIRASLLPAKRDDEGNAWEGLANIDLTLHDGKQFWVGLYDSNEKVAAFSAGPTHDARTYYRGGNTAELIRAIDAAFEKSKSDGE